MSDGTFGSERRPLPGRLFVVEGIDGSGKSTQLSLLAQWLRGLGYPVVFSEWNSSPVVKAATSRGKRRRILTPLTFSLIHATDSARSGCSAKKSVATAAPARMAPGAVSG